MKKIFVYVLLLCAAFSGCNKPMAPSQPYASGAPAATETPSLQEWEEVKPPEFYEPRSGHASVYFQNKYFVMSGSGEKDTVLGNICYDGLKWVTLTAESLPEASEYSSACVFGGKIILAGGKNLKGASDVLYYSNDGVKWQKNAGSAGFGPVYGHGFVTGKGKIWLLGGMNSEGDFREEGYFSKDGVKFEKIKTDGSEELFGKRAFFTAASFKGKIAACGGRTPAGLTGSVIFSQDGADWETATKQAAFGPREKHAIAVYKGRLWVSGGLNEKKEALDDLWWSEDGANWVSVTAKESYGARHSHSMAEVRGMLLITGGERNGKKLNDTRRSK